MKYALVDENNIVVNVIQYNGTDPYVPSVGLTIKPVGDWIDIGHDADLPLPVYPLLDDQAIKEARNNNLATDLSVVASYSISLEKDPNLSFSDYLDNLETKSIDLIRSVNIVKSN